MQMILRVVSAAEIDAFQLVICNNANEGASVIAMKTLTALFPPQCYEQVTRLNHPKNNDNQVMLMKKVMSLRLLGVNHLERKGKHRNLIC